MFKSAFVFLVVFTAAVDGPAQDRVDPPLVTVSGQAEVMVQPDEVVFNLRAVTLDKILTSGVVGSYSEEDSTIALGQISITAGVLVRFELH